MIVALCRQHEVDILVLAESEIPDALMLESLNMGEISQFRLPSNPSERLRFFIKYPHDSLKPIRDDRGIAIRHLTPPIGIDITLVALHLPSKLHMSDIDQASHSVQIAQMIQEAEEQIGHTRTLIIGDLNMNPFEAGVIGANALHGVMDKNIARRGSRTVQGRQYGFFYNPMWGKMGDMSQGPPGTYYYSNSNYVNFFWNMFDQVLMRPDLIDYFAEERLQILTSINGESLLATDGRPQISFGSDHLPVLTSFHIEEG